MSLLVTSLLVAGGVLVGRWIMRSPPKRNDGAPSEEPKSDATAEDEGAGEKKEAPPAPAGDPFERFAMKLGDVVMRAGGDEAWLAGALVFSEEIPVAALFIAPDAGGDRAVFARAEPSDALAWLSPLAAGAIVTGAEPPTSLEHAGTRFERARRLPVRVSRAGSGAPDVGERLIVAEYNGPAGERLLVLVGAETRAWRGVALEPGTYDVLPGKQTLD